MSYKALSLLNGSKKFPTFQSGKSAGYAIDTSRIHEARIVWLLPNLPTTREEAIRQYEEKLVRLEEIYTYLYSVAGKNITRDKLTPSLRIALRGKTPYNRAR